MSKKRLQRWECTAEYDHERWETEIEWEKHKDGDWCESADVEKLEIQLDNLLKELEETRIDLAVALEKVNAKDRHVETLKSRLSACSQELRARREYADACNGERFISEQAWEHARKRIDELRAATDAAGGVD